MILEEKEMKSQTNCFIFLALFLIGLALLSTAKPSFAIWRSFLDEDFNRDQQIPDQRWPWMTDLRRGIRWHWNPQPAHRLSEGAERSNYCWGLQDLIYNRNITPAAEIQQALWCAFTNLNNPNQPRWPDEDDYENNQNAWVWWGPVSLSDAVRAGVSFWMLLDLDHFARDSLSAFAVNRDPADLIDEDFFENVPIGRSYSVSIAEDWVQQTFYLDSLVLAGDEENLVSMLGEEEVWIGFVWQSDNWEIAGKGAFIDDVNFSWDDGLFDIYPLDQYFGYRMNGDSTRWMHVTPQFEEEVRFRCDYEVRGRGETPEFTINCYVDEELFYSEAVVREGDQEGFFTAETDEFWTAAPNSHTVRWELDTPLDENGAVEESVENNNMIDTTFNVPYNPPPRFTILEPDSKTELDGRRDAVISWTIADSLDDEEFVVQLFWADDTAGFAESPESVIDANIDNFIGADYGAGRGEANLAWSWRDYIQALDLDSQVHIIGFAHDGFAGNYSYSVSEGTFVYSLKVNKIDDKVPESFGIGSVYPNPFNDAISLNFAIKNPGKTTLSIYDMSGKLVSGLFEQEISAGDYNALWRPQNNPAGVYLAKLQSGTETSFKKVVYLP